MNSVHAGNFGRGLGICGAAIACLLSIVSFWRMGSEVRDAILVTDYVTQISHGQQKSFGYGGEMPEERVDIQFQDRAMSNVCFAISRNNGGHLYITGRNDRIYLRREWHPIGEQILLDDGDRFITRGPLGRATFRVLAGASNSVQLRLESPVFRDFTPGETRLVVGPVHEFVRTPIDEIHIRASASEMGASRAYQLKLDRCGLVFVPEVDHGQNQGYSGSLPACLASGKYLSFGPVRTSFRHYAGRVGGIFGQRWNRVQLFGIKLVMAILLIAWLFSLPPQTRWPHGATIFGCVALMVSVGIVLTARDFYFEPHASRFPTYLRWLYVALVTLFVLRIPFFRRGILLDPRCWRSMLVACLGFLAVYLLLQDPFDGSNYPLWLAGRAVLASVGIFLGLFVGASVFIWYLLHRLEGWARLEWDDSQFMAAWLLTLSPLFLVLVNWWLLGGREAIHFLGFRIHFPTLFVPLLIFSSSWLVWVTETEEQSRNRRLLLTILLACLLIGIYRAVSDDNGGMILMAIGFLSALWLGSSNKAFVAMLTVFFSIAVYGATQIISSPRFELAWGTQEQQLLYYDPATNLRMGRDLARAGGWLGLGNGFFMPAALRSNLHNDLVATYIAGYLGWSVLAIIVIAYFIFYTRLYGSLYAPFLELCQSKERFPIVAKDARWILINTSGALIITFAVQSFWMLTASIQKRMPLTGLDLHPISASNISILSFFVILLGSVALVHNLITQEFPSWIQIDTDKQ